jgi:hypothetical protein
LALCNSQGFKYAVKKSIELGNISDLRSRAMTELTPPLNQSKNLLRLALICDRVTTHLPDRFRKMHSKK